LWSNYTRSIARYRPSVGKWGNLGLGAMTFIVLWVETPLCIMRTGPDKQQFKRAKISRCDSELTDNTLIGSYLVANP